MRVATTATCRKIVVSSLARPAQIAAGTVSPAFGQVVVTGPNYTPREIQFALKLLF